MVKIKGRGILEICEFLQRFMGSTIFLAFVNHFQEHGELQVD